MNDRFVKVAYGVQCLQRLVGSDLQKTAFLGSGKNYSERGGQGATIGAGIGGGLGAAGGGLLGGLAGLGGGAALGGKKLPGALLGMLGGAGAGALLGSGAGVVPGYLGGLQYEALRDPSLRERLGLGGGPDPFG